MVNQFVSAEAIDAVKMCSTTKQEIVAAFGEPNGTGQDGPFVTLQWAGMLAATRGDQTAVSTQVIMAWVDAQGLVAGIVVNPMGPPTKPEPCPVPGADATE